MLPAAIEEKTKELLVSRAGEPVEIRRTGAVGGGCINDARVVDTSAGRVFVKHNDAGLYPGMFEAEARGLQLLADAGTLKVPEVVGWGDAGSHSMLVLEYIEGGVRRADFWEAFGAGLAQMHRQKPQTARFGLDHDNYIGSLPQRNKRHSGWVDFFVAERLEVQLKMARDAGKVGKEMVRMFGALYPHLPDFFPEEPPALLHGDLWSGNYMTGPEGQAAIIDPAVYYGHRYMDLGMSKLFGGFSTEFYQAYAEAYPMDAAWQQCMDIANLYPLMVHVNLFGGGYPASVKSVLRRFA